MIPTRFKNFRCCFDTSYDHCVTSGTMCSAKTATMVLLSVLVKEGVKSD